MTYKLRAWDVLVKVMHYDYERMYIKSGNERDVPSGVIFQSDIYQHNFDKWPPELDFEMKLIEMNYIFVNDRNGKEIYVDDLVRVTKHGKNFLGLVVYNSGGCPFARDVDFDAGQEGRQQYAYFDDNKASFEVVGNIYENSEMCPKLKIIVE